MFYPKAIPAPWNSGRGQLMLACKPGAVWPRRQRHPLLPWCSVEGQRFCGV